MLEGREGEELKSGLARLRRRRLGLRQFFFGGSREGWRDMESLIEMARAKCWEL